MAISRQVRYMIGAAVLVTAAGLVSVALRPASPRQLFFGLRDELQAARLDADDCRSALVAEEARFRRLMQRTDSLRLRVGAYERLDRRGVPADSYRVYLETIDSFNAALPDWETASDSLAVHRDSCESLVLKHNLLADSARSLAEEANLIDSSLDTAGTR
jgi:hypothetical protein